MPTKCPQCEQMIPAGNDVCHYCGYKPKLVERKVQQTIDSDGTNVLKFIAVASFVVLLLAIAAAILLSGNTSVTVITSKENKIVFNCLRSTDCELPMDYAIRSNCPYQAYCSNYQCVVACPMWEDRLNKWDVKCKDDADCNCSMWDSEGKYDCKCLDKQCVSVVDTIK